MDAEHKRTMVAPVTGLRRLNPVGQLFSVLRFVWPSDKYLWPAARVLGRLSGLPRGHSVFRTADGTVMHLDPFHYPDGAMLYGTFEVSTVRLLQQILRPGDIAIDVGANIGYYSIRFSELVGPDGRVLAFEPVPTTFARLQANLARNGCTNVETCQVALNSQAGDVTIYETDSHGIAGLKPLSDTTIPHQVGGTRLDDHLAAHPTHRPVRLVKIDVEGAEHLVLQGAQALIARDRPHILLEKFGTALMAYGRDFASVAELITRHGGYRIQTVDGQTDLTDANAEKLNYAREGNYLFTPA